jgi:hypothetical protein
VRLDYSLDNGVTWVNITTSTTNDGSQNWTVPATANSTQCRIKISNTADLNIFDISDAVFTIATPITVTAPNGGENWIGCATVPITFVKSPCIQGFDIFYSTNNGTTWTIIVNGLNDNGLATQTYNWQVPNGITSTQALIKVEDDSYVSNVDVSNADLHIPMLQNIGIAFHPDSLPNFFPTAPSWIYAPLANITPQILNSAVQIVDKDIWYELKGSFIANGDENYLTMGCFADSGLLQIINSPIGSAGTTYTYIDDVSVTELKALHSRDTVICANTTFPITIKAYPGFDFYIWSTGDTTRSITISGPGDYYITAASWCGVISDTLTVSYFDSSQYNQYLGADLNLCPNQFPYLLHTNPLGLINYQWSTGDSTENIFLNQDGQYILTANSQCHTMIDTILVNALIAPELQLGNDTVLCNNQSMVLQANAAQNYLWSTNETTQNITVNQTGNYSVNITYSNGCSVSDTISITAYNPINYMLNLGNDTVYCQTDFPIQLQTNNLLFDTYLWNTGSVTNTTVASTTGNYFLSANYICSQVTDTITLNLAPNPILNLGNDTTLCIGQQITLNAGNHNSYTWSYQSLAPSITINETGNYSVTVSNALNCIANDNIQVNFVQETAQLLPNDTALFVSAFPYIINLSNEFTNYQSPQLSIVNNQLSIESEGMYSLAATDINGCLVSDSISLSLKKFELIVPSIIRKNQNFILNNLPAKSSLKIFDALGQIIYQSNNYQNNFMPLVANAVYFVELEYDVNNQNEKYKGKLVVVE